MEMTRRMSRSIALELRTWLEMKRKYVQIFVLGVVVASLAACGGGRQLVITGETLDSMGKQFVTTANMYNSLHDQGQITDDEYRAWAEFARYFKVVYPATVDMWQEAARQPDAEGTREIIRIIQNMKNRLFEYYLQALSKGGHQA